jgi:predicted enzyme related to lactoylglutathione lyase
MTPKVNYFAIPADDPERAIGFYQSVFNWRFEVQWEYDTPHGREKNWKILNDDSQGPGIDGGLTRKEFAGQPIGVGIEVQGLDDFIQRVQDHGGKIVVGKMALPNVGFFSVCQDSEGNTFVMYERAKVGS